MTSQLAVMTIASMVDGERARVVLGTTPIMTNMSRASKTPDLKSANNITIAAVMVASLGIVFSR